MIPPRLGQSAPTISPHNAEQLVAATHWPSSSQTSPEPHWVPATTGSCTTPVRGPQESAVQGLPSSTTGDVPDAQAPAPSHVSSPLHRSPSAHDVPAATGSCVTPAPGSQPSTVHGLPSSTAGGVPAPQAPAPSHVSSPLHRSPSAHDVPAATGSCVTPFAGSQLSDVHGLPSSTTGGVPAAQTPAPSHVSSPLHASPSPHDVPAATAA